MSSRGRRRRLGFQRERELTRKLWKLGFACMRAPASGAKTRRTPYPDLIAIKNRRVFIMEVKTREKRETIYVADEQIQRLLEFARRAGGVALVAVKYMDGSGWRFVRVDELGRTKSGLWRVTPDDVERGMTLDEINAIASVEAPIDAYLKGGRGGERG